MATLGTTTRYLDNSQIIKYPFYLFVVLFVCRLGSAKSMVTGDLDNSGQDEVIIDFGDTYGLWIRMNNSSWSKLHSLSAESMVTTQIE